MSAPAPTSPPAQATLRFGVTGMTCASCAGRVEKALLAVPGVLAASVNLATETASVTVDDGVSAAMLAGAVHKAGYGVAIEEVSLGILGMSCASCVGRIEKALAAVPGVAAASVNLATESVRVQALAGTPRVALEAAVETAGYAVLRPQPVVDQAAPKESDRLAAAATAASPAALAARRETRHLVLAALLSLPLALPMLGMPFDWHWALPGCPIRSSPSA